ncbi:exo-rhamnogalacturonan lyase family protein [Pseudoduganella aquatica]|uniref:Tat pathway signal sequence domain protein n=1 Tax=Pseudoduganella aquatica TaxID=2660641 RepID=A0A7X4H8H9_9BURK|nr:Tat pathway signal sequence domain protein [Pseudoduganella aquatica]MYN05887.1 Tat pathway signal sequence domain protein [Pseudoduganella aquatica]
MTTPFSRRSFLQASMLASLPLATAKAQPPAATPASGPAAPAIQPTKGAALQWLEGSVPALSNGATVGLPWPKGAFPKDQSFVLAGAAGEVAVQTWPLAYWPDGSLKWTGHALPAGAGLSKELAIKPGKAAAAAMAVRVQEGPNAVEVDTGVIRATIPRKGVELISAIRRDGRDIARGGRLVALTDDQPDASAGAVRQTSYESTVKSVTLEQNGPVRAVLRIEGKHRSGQREWLPFTVRLYFYAGAESVRIMHTFVFDGDEHKDYLRGIGVRFAVPLTDEMHNRHVRFAGENKGVWGEGVRTLTGLRRDPGEAFRKAQVAGVPVPPLEQMNKQVSSRLNLIPAWGDFTLSQLSADGFQIRKRTKPGHGWIDASWGRRAAGSGYIGGISGGVAFGLRDFWQRHPTQLDIRNAHTDAAEVTLWMWSPDAPAMDMRFYHDGMGMETHEQEREGLEITYEDYEKGYGSPVGVARSSEITLYALAATPSRERMAQLAEAVQLPPQLVSTPAHYLACNVFGGMWSLPDRSHPLKARIEDELDRRFDYYRSQIEQHHWYGFWNYGDLMHTYDEDRHSWRYDVGGYAWDNSELSPDLWLWYSFLRTGRADIFRLSEAMVRHTSEVDMYHLGQFAGLGTRHNVQHWGCSAKQVRISAAVYRRFYYYLTADERVGDIMRELLDADSKLAAVDPVRKLKDAPPPGKFPVRAAFGTDWGSLAGNWLTEWERGGKQRYRDKLLAGMHDIGAMPKGFFNAERAGYEPDTGRLHNLIGDDVKASHLNAVFGAVEIFAELISLTGDAAFEKAWVQYCAMYNAPKAEQAKVLGKAHNGTNALQVGHSRLTAYAAWRSKDAALAKRAWREFSHPPAKPVRTVRISGPAVLNPVDEVAWISTNDTAQWGLAAIQNLALVGDYIE